MADLSNQKIKSFRLAKGRTSLKQIGLILLVALFFLGLVWLGGWGADRQIDNGKVAQKELTETEKELKFQEQVAEIVKSNDFAECEKVNDAIYKTVCVNNIALNLAKETQDISYCQKIDDKLIPRSDCERQVVFVKSIEKENIEICQETKNQELQKQCEDSFYLQLALKKGDIKICDQITEKDKVAACYNNFLVTKNFNQNYEEFNCSSLKGVDVQKDCEYAKQFIKKRDISLCVNLKTNFFSPYCF